MIIAILVVVLIGVLLLWILLPPVDNPPPEIVSYQSGAEEKKKVEKPRINRAVERKPTSPSSSMAKVIASNTVSDIAIPVPEKLVSIESMDYGIGDDFGDGWGDEDWGSGGGTTFFGQTVVGERILYIIDYSGSMRGRRQELMRAELADSVKNLPAGKQFQMIFFAGPAWVAGDEVSGSTVKAKDGKEYQWKGKGSFNWTPVGKLQQPKWLDVTDPVIKKSVKLIETHKLVGGTVWSNPLEMAFSMDPLPQVIVFMTDGSAGPASFPTAENFSKLAKKKGVLINTVALMQPKVAKAMEALAKPTGGTFSLINENGKKVDVKDAKLPPKKKKKKKKGKKK
jgi:hypothetical protein